MAHFHKINNLIGFLLFGIATAVYWLTMEPTLSFWDCGEFIAASYKLQVGHQPGAPLFLMIGKLFSLLAIGNTAKIAYWVNFSSVVFSAATIMFLYWTITLIANRLYPIRQKSLLDHLTIISAGVVGALGYTFSDTFWFSAVEAEVYSLSALLTAIVFWSIFKWENKQDDKWLVFIAFVVGLSIGVHLLSLLAIPAVVLVYYFKKATQPNWFGVVKALGISGAIWVGVQFVIIQYFVLFAAKTDMYFVNNLGLGFGSGAVTFLVVLCGLLAYGNYYSIKTHKYNLNLAMVCLTFIMFGFASYFMIMIRANAKPSLNLSNPDNAYSLYNYIGRTNYGQTPFVYGQTFDAQSTDIIETGTDYRKGKEKYEDAGKLMKAKYDKNLFFPRTYSNKPAHQNFYKQWLRLPDGVSPSFADNLNFFSSYQVGFMYWRYFLWNFAGRQNDIQGQGGNYEGNWITGVKALDAMRLGNQDKLPLSITANEGYNRYFGLPLILGIAGLFFLYRKNKRDTLVIITLFVFTGLAIIIYLNQDPLQVRERDYAYVGSFYAFAIFMGFGVFAIREMLAKFSTPKLSLIAASIIGLLSAPVLMVTQGWDDHNRSNKTTALEWAKNYLNSCAPNAILFTNADNDMFPLWYAQEVENIRTDVRVVNIQYLADDSYINQMKKQMNASAPLPIKMPEEKYVKGVRDYLPYFDYGITDSVELKELLAVLTSDSQEDKLAMMGGTYENFLPTKKLKLTIDPDQVIKTKTVSATENKNIVNKMEWTFDKKFASKSDLTMFDILINNNWERPIYFASGVTSDTYMGLERYLYLEGYAFRLLPLKRDDKDLRAKEEVTNSDVMYNNVIKKFDFSGFKTAKYLDPESRRILQSTVESNNILATNLFIEGKFDQARNIMTKNINELPLRCYSIDDTLTKFHSIQNLYALNDTKNANLMAKETTDFLDQELSYIISLEPKTYESQLMNIRRALYVLSGLDKITSDYKQTELNRSIKKTFDRLKVHFI